MWTCGGGKVVVAMKAKWRMVKWRGGDCEGGRQVGGEV